MFGALAYAEDEMVERAKNEADMKKIGDEMNVVCESSIRVTIDWDSFAKSDWRDYSVSSYCGAPVETLAEFCAAKKGASKAHIREKIKSITCSYGGEGKRALNIESGDKGKYCGTELWKGNLRAQNQLHPKEIYWVASFTYLNVH